MMLLSIASNLYPHTSSPLQKRELRPMTLVLWFLPVVLLRSPRLVVAFSLVAWSHLIGLKGFKDLTRI
ncbi:hypothetical protein RHMOL_Rhmol04G0087800 [Rhododendron molle]|uniref:Uncharacterized protein n=1 Tax=Rhododendron molle TaxID=49168 RepID=A0ACC0P020_RHOML|nr:hypothetical protein RHMOL_Rhmol04G0087800 [Rhododendron molle]